MAERTQGPWILNGSTIEYHTGRMHEAGGDEYPERIVVAMIGHLSPHQGDLDGMVANGEFIVRAANAHDALVAAALAAAERCVACAHEREWHGERACSMCAGRDVLDACRMFRADEGLRAALALAEERDHAAQGTAATMLGDAPMPTDRAFQDPPEGEAHLR